MYSFTYFYQHLPYFIDPIAARIGSFSISWYALMYVAAFLTVFFLLLFRLKKNEGPSGVNPGLLFDFLLWSFFGLLIGARLGEILLYDFSHFRANPLAIISPFDPSSGEFVGIYGMSYHGGVAGALVAGYIFLRKKQISFWTFADFVVPAVPLGYFWGRIGNFMNGELYGRTTDKAWGMYFDTDPANNYIETTLRHPSQIYEAMLEGIMLFLILWPIRNTRIVRERMLFLYVIGYSIARIIAEFFREPDGYILKYLTLGQFYSLLFIIMALSAWKLKRKGV